MSFVAHIHGQPKAPAANRQSPHDPIRLIAELTEPHIASVIALAMRKLKLSLTDQVIYRGLNHGMADAIAPAMTKFASDLDTTKLFLANAHMQAGTATARQFAVRKDTLSIDLDTLPQPTLDALDDYDFGLVREVSDEVRQSIADAVTEGVKQGLPPAGMARMIRGSIGLTDSQAQAVDNYRSLLETGSTGALDRQLRDARFDPTVQDAINTNTPLSPDMVDKLVTRYQDRYLSFRANTIARYESLRASNLGSSDAIQSAIEDGSVDAGDVTTHWMIADDEATCPACLSIVDIQPDGVPYGSSFQWQVITRKGGRSGTIDLAPLHPACRCTCTYRVAA